MQTLISFLLSLSTLLSGITTLFANDDAAAEPVFAPTAQEDSLLTDVKETYLASDRLLAPAEPAAAFGDIEYVHYDPEPFYESTDDLRELARSGRADAVNTLYDRLYNEFLYIDSLAVLTMLRQDQDFYDEYWSGEYLYMDELWSLTADALSAACAEVLTTSCAASFEEHIGAEAAESFRTYTPMTDEEIAAYDRELELLQEYLRLYDSIDDVTYSYGGEDWCFDDLYGWRGDSLYYSDYDAYQTILGGLQQKLNEVFAPLYIELVGLLTDTARAAGYDSYTDYAYEITYGRSYSPEDAQAFCDAVKPIAREYYADLYYSDLFYDYDLVHPVLRSDELIDVLGEYLPQIDESLLEPWTAMQERGLYDISKARSGRYDGSYTTVMLYFQSPFLFATLEGDCYDLMTITHEFGHFCDYWFNPQSNTFAQTDDLDLSEIHSNGLQALFTQFYGDIYYSKGVDIAEFINLSSLLENVFDGCIYDEFQRRILDDPDDLTPEKLNAVHREVCAEYGLDNGLEWDSGWVYIAHNFEQPLYYFSYAASAMAALQIWDIAQEDPARAVSVYLDVLDRGSYREGYMQVLPAVGLRLFTEDGAAEAVCRPVLERLAALDRAYWSY